MSKKDENALTLASAGSQIMPQNYAELERFAQTVAKTDMVPKDFRDKPGNCLIAMMMGHELGLPYLQALQGIAVINGRPSVWGDTALAIVQSKDTLEIFEERDQNEALKSQEGMCTIQRKGAKKPHVVKYSVQDAKTAGLWGKQGPWTTAPGRMLQMRARAFALRDKCSDILKGISIVEEVQDYEVLSNVAPGVDLVKSATSAIGPKPETALGEAATDAKSYAGAEAKANGYYVQKVTESAVKKGLYFVHIDGNKYSTTNLEMAKKASEWSKSKTLIDFEEELEGGSALLVEIHPVAEEAVPA